MEAALANAGEVATSLRLYVDEVDAGVGRFVPLCVAKVNTPALLKLKMLLDGHHEVFQQWEHPEEEEEEEEEEEGEELRFVSHGPVSTRAADPAGGLQTPVRAAASSNKRGVRVKTRGVSGRIRRGGRAAGPAVGFESPHKANTSTRRGSGERGDDGRGIGERGGGEARRAPITSSRRIPYCNTAEIKGYNPEYARPVVYHFFHHDVSAFDLEEESTIQPLRHTAAPAAELNWSANILSIKVLRSTVGYPVNLYGSVYVRDDLDRKRVYLFRRDRDNAQLVKSPEETLALTGPSRGLVVFDNLFFEIDLKMRCDQEVAGMNFSQGSTQYSNVSNSSWLLDYRSYLLTDELATEVSTVELMYAPVRRAVEASIQIKAPEYSAHGEGVLSLYGRVSAFITGISEEIVLFDSEASGSVLDIRNDGLFELWRSVISVPIDGSLTLRVETWEGDSKANLSICSTIFTPQICDENVAPCALHPFRIKVAWSPLYIVKFDLNKFTV